MKTMTRVETKTTSYYSIRQTTLYLTQEFLYSGHFSSKEEAEEALSPAERGMYGGLVTIVRITSTRRVEVDTNIEIV